MTSKNNIDSSFRGFFFAPSGNNNFDGRTVERPKATMQAAVDATQNLVPPPSAVDVSLVTTGQGGSFAGGFTLEEFIIFDGRNVVLINTDPASITMASNSILELTVLSNSAAASTCILFNGLELSSFVCGLVSVTAINGIGIDITGACEEIFTEVKRLRMRGEGATGVRVTSTQSIPHDLDYESVGLQANNTTFMEYDCVNSTDQTILAVSSISNTEGITTFTGTTAFDVKAGHLIVETIGTLVADTAIHVHPGARLDIGSASSILGDIIVDLGGELNCLILKHNGGTITNNGTINGIIDGIPFDSWRQKPIQEFNLTGSSFNTQSPVGTNSVLQVEFGAAQFGPSDPVQIDILGSITINQTDQYLIDFLFHAGRTGAGSFAVLLFRILINGAQTGDSVAIRLDNANTHFPVEISLPLNLSATDVLTVEIWRDPSGFDAGDLFPETPTLIGSNPVPSAAVTITRYRLTQPI